MARLVEIDGDGLHVKAYFDQNLPDYQSTGFGYQGEGMIYCIPFRYHPRHMVRVDRKMLPKSMRFPVSSGGIHDNYSSYFSTITSSRLCAIPTICAN